MSYVINLFTIYCSEYKCNTNTLNTLNRQQSFRRNRASKVTIHQADRYAMATAAP
jgi:hypothetical protein